MKKVKLKDLAYTRSGDKGDHCTVGLLAFNRDNYEILRKHVTQERVKAFFGDMVRGPVKIYELPNLNIVHLVLHNALGGGATRTLRFDQTGKSMGTALLRMEIEVA
ncbi:MAG: hypothetical protein FJX78_04155 [Armatimonadetes bacterium]|nr:hypothetical protein [Armatimonadota bacterium]